MSRSSLVLGTRGSPLALWQARHIAARLEESNPSLTVSLNVIRTRGDAVQDAPLSRIGGKGLFTREIEDALLEGRIDLAVHSMKDLPTTLPPGLCLGAIPSRESPWDALVARGGLSWERLPLGARVGTSSLRRRAQILSVRPDLQVVDLRGNVDTRLRKVEEGEVDAAILALAGLKRLKREEGVSEVLSWDVMVPAVGQGALGIEIREGDQTVSAALLPLHDPISAQAVEGERRWLHALQGGCQVPAAAHVRPLEHGGWEMRARVGMGDGTRSLSARAAGMELGSVVDQVLHDLLEGGAEEILAKARVEEGVPGAWHQ